MFERDTFVFQAIFCKPKSVCHYPLQYHCTFWRMFAFQSLFFVLFKKLQRCILKLDTRTTVGAAAGIGRSCPVGGNRMFLALRIYYNVLKWHPKLSQICLIAILTIANGRFGSHLYGLLLAKNSFVLLIAEVVSSLVSDVHRRHVSFQVYS